MAIESVSQRPLEPVQTPPQPTVAEKGREEARAAPEPQREPPPPPPPPAESGRGQNVDISV